MPDQSETMSCKIALMVIDKILLGGGIAIAGAVISIVVSHMQTVWSLQDKVFEKRFQAYAEIAQQADAVLVDLDSWYYDIPITATGSTSHQTWQIKITNLQHKFDDITGQGSGAGGGDLPVPFNGTIQDIRNLEQIKNKYHFLNPESMDEAFNAYLSIITTIIDEQLNGLKSYQQAESKDISPAPDKEAEQQQWKAVHDAHGRFLNELRGALGLTINPYHPYQLTTG